MEDDVRRIPAKARGGARRGVSRVRPVRDYDEYVDGKPRYEGVRSFLASRQIELPQGSPSDPPDKDTIDGLGNRKNELVLELIHRDGVQPYEGSVRFVQGGARRRAAARGRVIEHELPRRARSRPGSWTCSRRSSMAIVAEREHLAGKPAPDTFLAAARKRRRVEPAHAAVFEDALAGVEAGHAGASALVVGVDRVGQADALRTARRGRRRARTSPSCWSSRDPSPVVSLRAVGDPRDTTCAVDELGAARVGVRALQRPHRAARQPRRGRAVRAAGHVPRRLLRAAPAALR